MTSAQTFDYAALAKQYQSALLDDVLPFWENHSLDRTHGGYFTCLDRQGQVYDADKFIWLQNRQVWTFSSMAQHFCSLADSPVSPERIEQWIAIARHGADFLAKHGRDPEGNWYFSLNQAGQPLTQPHSIFSDCFAAMAFSQYAKVTGDSESEDIARQAYANVLRRQDNPKGQYNKVYPGTRSLKSLAVPMILANLTLEMGWLLPTEQLDQVLDQTIAEVMADFWDGDRNLMREAVAPDGSTVNSYEGRLINPGHGIEALWFMMDIGEQRSDRALIDQAIDRVLSILNFAWDTEHGGLFYFMDADGHPPQQLEWDQKLWWVHLETLVALALGYRLTGRQDCWHWYQKLHDYSWSHFVDAPGPNSSGEWFGYLTRRGDVLLSLKGGKWKGCFHVPRAMHLCWQQFSALTEQSGTV